MRLTIEYNEKNNDIISFSAQELARLLGQMCPDSLITINNHSTADTADLTIVLKTADLCHEYQMEPVPCPELDDQYVISVQDCHGVIAGSNDRSVLLGVYHYLKSLGCRFLAPGTAFEAVPVCTEKQQLFCHSRQTAAFRHRGVCIEGANSLENILDFIDWLPKLGCSCFFLQFQLPYTFMARWYHHEMNPLLTPETFSRETAQAYTQQIVHAMKKRGVLLHQAGHGWTAQAIGMDAFDWKEARQVLTAEEAQKVALLDGKRQLFHGIPMNTNLCYSNPDAIESFTRQVLDYVCAHPKIDYLHVWLADEPNNICECESCQKTTPSDQYVELLNHIDQELTRIGSPVKIAFLLYQELLFPPRQAKLQNPDRFLLMFAPISRTFSQSYQPKDDYGPVPVYRRNQFVLPADLDENMAYLAGWQAYFSGDSFIYDYPLGRAHYGDLGYVHISRIIHEDIQKIRSMKLNGYISCQELRAWFPNALPNYVMGYTLFDPSRSFEELTEEYFSAAYGDGWEEVRTYLTQVSALCSCDYFNGKGPRIQPEVAQHMEQLIQLVQAFRPVCQAHKNDPSPVNLFWKQLDYHCEYSLQLGKALFFLASGDTAQAQETWRTFQEMICRNECSFQSCLDVYRVSEVATKYTGFQLEEALRNTL